MPRKSQLKQISYSDVPQFIKELHKKNGISRELFTYRINKAKPRLDMYVAATRPPMRNGVGARKYVKERELCKKYGIPYDTFYSRVVNGWDLKHACTLPVDKHRVLTDEEIRYAEEKGITARRVRKRMEKGWSKEKALHTPLGEGHFFGERNPYIVRAEQKGIGRSTYYRRIKVLKWTEEEACTIPVGGSREYTVEQNEQFLSLGLNLNTVRNRINFHKWSVEKAVSTPYKSVEGVN
jgi:hypothetical protein